MLQLMLDTGHEFGMMAGRIKQSFVKELLIFEQQSGRWEKLNSSNATWLNHHTNYQTWTPEPLQRRISVKVMLRPKLEHRNYSA